MSHINSWLSYPSRSNVNRVLVGCNREHNFTLQVRDQSTYTIQTWLSPGTRLQTHLCNYRYINIWRITGRVPLLRTRREEPWYIIRCRHRMPQEGNTVSRTGHKTTSLADQFRKPRRYWTPVPIITKHTLFHEFRSQEGFCKMFT